MRYRYSMAFEGLAERLGDSVFSYKLQWNRFHFFSDNLDEFLYRNFNWILVITSVITLLFANIAARLFSVFGVFDLLFLSINKREPMGYKFPHIRQHDNVILYLVDMYFDCLISPKLRNDSDEIPYYEQQHYTYEKFGTIEKIFLRLGFWIGFIAAVVPGFIISVSLLPLYNLAFFINVNFLNPDPGINVEYSSEAKIILDLGTAAQRQFKQQVDNTEFLNVSHGLHNKNNVGYARYRERFSVKGEYIYVSSDRKAEWFGLKGIINARKSDTNKYKADFTADEIQQAQHVLGLTPLSIKPAQKL